MIDVTNLLLEMLERISLVAVSGYLLTQTTWCRRIISHKMGIAGSIVTIAIFSSMGIFGTYLGVPVSDAIANSREIIIMVAGLLFGPVIGTLTGLITGLHRYTLGGFTAIPCSLSCIIAGLISGFISRRYHQAQAPWGIIFALGLIVNLLQMGMILVVARPFSQALHLVNMIALPMTLANSIGLVIFVIIIRRAYEQEDRIAAEQSHKALHIANHTLPYLRSGLTEKTAQAAVDIILHTTKYAAVAMTDTHEVLGFAGAESDHHAPHMNPGLTQATQQTLQSGEITIAMNPHEIGCFHEGCRLASAIVVPLFKMNHIAGTLKLYYVHKKAITHSDVVFAKDIGTLFSTQLDLAELDNQAQLAAKAKLLALHMQINPHFLFNTLNTIASLIRTQPDAARHTLTKLSTLFRFALQKAGKIISIREELQQVSAYLDIAKIRNGNKLTIVQDMDPAILSYGIPSLTLQPLLENAIQHGLSHKEEGGTLTFQGRLEKEGILFIIRDDGVGMKVTPRLFEERENHIGIHNVHSRLRGQYGDAYGLEIQSQPGIGTTVYVRLPRQTLPGLIAPKEVSVHA